MSLIYTKISTLIIAPITVLAAIVILLLVIRAQEREDFIDLPTVPQYSISLGELTPEFFGILKREFLIATGESDIHNNPGYLKLLISLDTNYSNNVNSCILYGDIFENCGCIDPQKISMSRYMLNKEADFDRWRFICSGIISLPHYFNPKSSKDMEGGD